MFPSDPNLEMDFTLESERSGVVDEPAFRLLVLGDWSGDAPKPIFGGRKPVEIDRDNFDDVMRGLGVCLDLDVAAEPLRVEFNGLDDFHPDEIFKRVPLFLELRDLRKRLRNSDTFRSASREVRDLLSVPEPVTAAEPPAVSDVQPSAAGLLDSILDRPDGGTKESRPGVSPEISRLVSDLVRPHLVSVDENEQSAMIEAVDQAISALMRSILHHRRFQQLEAGWRGLFFLVRRTETSSDLKIFVLDAAKDELTTDLKTSAGTADSVFYKRIMAASNGEPWAAVVGNYVFCPDVDDAAALIRLGSASAAANVPFISHIRPEVIGVSTLADHPDPAEWDLSGSSDAARLWNAVRESPGSDCLGMTMPRFLARLPYGSATEPVEAFSFEEFTDNPVHDDYLWANSCFVAAQLLARTYVELGWSFGQRFLQDAEGFPLHIYKSEGETVYQSCAEVQLSEKAAQSLMELGIMPIVSQKNTDRIRLGRFQSISDPPRVLKGSWLR